MRKFCWHSLNTLFNPQNSPLIIGICVGIAVSLVLTPFINIGCSRFSSQLPSSISLRDLRSNNVEEDFEPSITLDKNSEINKNADEDKQTSKLIRPRYYSTELGMKDKVLVSVISAKDSISSYGTAVNKTLNQYVDKLIFFLDGVGSKKLGLHIPVVGFKERKPLIKIFRIISYINENYIEDYNYFVFVTDHTYVNGRRLMSVLEKLSTSFNVHMGIPQDNGDSLYCNLDNGIILSQSILEAVGKELLWCIKHAFSDSESDNLGRCILHASKLPCSSVYQDQTFRSFIFQDNEADVEKLLKTFNQTESNFDKSVTVGNILQPTDIYQLHVYFLKEFVLQSKKEILSLREDIAKTVKSSPLDIFSSWPVGSPSPHVATTRYNVITWETFNLTHIFVPNDFQNVKLLNKVDTLDIMSVVDAGVAHLKTKPGMTDFSFKQLSYGHRRYDPTRGMDYLLSLAFTDPHGEVVYKRIEAYRGLTQPEIIPMPYVTESSRVNVMLFIEAGDVEDAREFLTGFVENVKIQQITLTFNFLYNKGEAFLAKDDPYKGLKERLKSFTKKFYDVESRANFSHVTVPDGRPSDVALLDIALKNLPGDALVLVAQPRASIQSEFMNRVRMNTISNWQVFSPIPFTLYHPDLVSNLPSYRKMEVSSPNGHFDNYDYSTISFYVSDYFKVRKSMKKTLPLFRSEKDLLRDPKPSVVSVYSMFLRASPLHTLRGIEPHLVMRYGPIECPSRGSNDDVAEREVCYTRRSLSFGQLKVLSNLVVNFEEKTPD